MEARCFRFLSQFKWHLSAGYVVRSHSVNGKQKSLYMHRLINKTPKGMDTDHINGNKLDNRCINLRTVTNSQNKMNVPKRRGVNGKPCSSRFKGVHWEKSAGKWRAGIRVNGLRKHLGLFQSEEEAARVYDQHAKEYFKEFASVNF